MIVKAKAGSSPSLDRWHDDGRARSGRARRETVARASTSSEILCRSELRPLAMIPCYTVAGEADDCP